MKKTYQKPAMQVQLLQQCQMICISGGIDDPDSYTVQSLIDTDNISWDSDGIEFGEDDY